MATGFGKFPTDDRGRIRLYVGYHINAKGKRVQMPFYFGSDPAQVPGRLGRVNELWAHVQAKAMKPTRASRRGEPKPIEPAVWDEEGKWLAKELASGKVQITIGRGTVDSMPAHPSQAVRQVPASPYAYAQRLKIWSQRWPMVWFVAEDEQAAQEGLKLMTECQENQIQQIRAEYGDITGTPSRLLTKKSETFYQAIDAYLAAIPAISVEPTENGTQLTAHGHNQLEYAARFKVHHKDCPLSALDGDGIQALADYWRNRPISEKTDGPMSHSYCKHHLDEMKRMFTWISKSKSFAWRKPEDFDDLNWRVRPLSSEKTAIKLSQVDTFTVDELAVIFRHATNLERLLILLGLNCTFGAAEMGTLREENLFLNAPHPNSRYLKQFNHVVRNDERFMIYARHKTGVHGEFLLWPETIKSLNWMLRRRATIETECPYLLVTEKGKPFVRKHSKNQTQHFRNKWKDDLFGRMAKAGVVIDWEPKPLSPAVEGSVRYLSFGKLRKTATDFMRQFAGGETASCFEMHDKVITDDLIDIYSNRPFGKVFEGLRQMHTLLQSVFEQELLYPDDKNRERSRKKPR